MKAFFTRYSHWIAFCIIMFSTLSTFVRWQGTTPEIIALVFGGVALIAVGYLAYLVERHNRKKSSGK